MSISRPTVGLLRALAFVFVTFLLPTGIPFAAENTFYPRFELGTGRQGNVAFIGQRPIPDNFLRIGLDLEFSTATERTSFNLRYRPSRIYYRDYPELDFGEHRLSARLDRSSSPVNHLILDALYYSGQGQGIDPDQPDAPVTLVPRTDVDRGTIRLGRETTGERSVVDWGVGISAARFDRTLGTTLEDANTLFAQLGYTRGLSERTSVGGTYDFQQFTYEEAGSVGVHSLMVVSKLRPGPFTDLRLGIGGFHAEGGSETRSAPTGELLVTREVGERNRLVAGIYQRVTVGTGLQQATLDRGGYVAWRVVATRAISATFNVAYWFRRDLADLEDPIQTGIRTFLTRETLMWNPSPVLGLGVHHGYNNQDTEGTADSRLDTSFHSGEITLLWSPRGQ